MRLSPTRGKASSAVKESLICSTCCSMSPEIKDRLVSLFFTVQIVLILYGSPLIFATLSWICLIKGLWILPLLYLVWYCYDFGVEERGGWQRLWFQSEWLKACFGHFPIKLVKTCALSPERNFILGSHPHGVFSIGAQGAFGLGVGGFDEAFPGVTRRLLVLKGFFLLPICREICLASGLLAATKKSVDYLLRSSAKGRAYVLIVGGAEESVEEQTDYIGLVLEKRTGFVRMAIKHGADLVPTFTFGENRLYKQIPLSKNFLLRWLRELFVTNPVFPFALRYGRGPGLLLRRGVAPFKVPLTVVVGEPIHVTQKDDPSQEDVDRLHGQYIKSLKRLYDAYNPIYGDPNTPIVIKGFMGKRQIIKLLR